MRGKGNLARVRDIMMFLVISSQHFLFSLTLLAFFTRIGTSSPCLNMYTCMYKYVNLSVQVVACKTTGRRTTMAFSAKKK